MPDLARSTRIAAGTLAAMALPQMDTMSLEATRELVDSPTASMAIRLARLTTRWFPNLGRSPLTAAPPGPIYCSMEVRPWMAAIQLHRAEEALAHALPL